MNTKHTTPRLRLTVLAALVTLAVPTMVGLQASVNKIEQEKQAKIEEIESVLQHAAAKERSVDSILAKKEDGKEQMKSVEQILSKIAREKRTVRLQLAEKRRLADLVRTKYGVDPDDKEALHALLETQRAEMQEFIDQYVRVQIQSASRSGQIGRSFVNRLVGASLGERVEEDLRYQALAKARMEMFSLISEVRHLPETLAVLEGQHQELIASYNDTLQDHDRAKAQVRVSDSQLAEIKRIVAEVDLQVRLMQKELSAYDEKIRRRAEKNLIAKGLRAPRDAKPSAPEFIWPVLGSITAGFNDSGYRNYFGVPHKAIDIRQAQGSSIRASADGIVYMFRDGGARGYSYILIGHRNGYATLYGHVLESFVQRGQDIDQGEVIGLSGGQPGTRGAGPMTTGPHLHFEIIKDGEHVDPVTMLPPQ